MTQNGFSVQIGDLVAAAPKFTNAGNDLANVIAAQSAVLNGLGAFWGTTAHGPDFGDKYQPAADDGLKLAQACGLAL